MALVRVILSASGMCLNSNVRANSVERLLYPLWIEKPKALPREACSPRLHPLPTYGSLWFSEKVHLGGFAVRPPVLLQVWACSQSVWNPHLCMVFLRHFSGVETEKSGSCGHGLWLLPALLLQLSVPSRHVQDMALLTMSPLATLRPCFSYSSGLIRIFTINRNGKRIREFCV